MFSNEDLKCLDPKYFSIITTDAYDVTIMSRNTGHYWHLLYISLLEITVHTVSDQWSHSLRSGISLRESQALAA